MSYANELEAQAQADLAAALQGHVQVALLPAPENSNPGDAAIWWGTVRLLRELGGAVGYIASIANYDADQLVHHVPHGPVLLRGGGNFGDLYPRINRLGMRVLSEFTDRPVIQLPQSLFYVAGPDSAASRRHAADLQAHPQVELFVREAASAALAREFLRTRAQLSPDHAMALADQLDQWGRQWAPTIPLLTILRSDVESAVSTPGSPGATAASIDWSNEDGAQRATWDQAAQRDWALLRLWEVAEPGSMDRALPMPAAVKLLERVCAARVRRAAKVLCAGSVIFTDRLHAALLGWMLGRQVVMLPNSYHKNRSFFDTWFADIGTDGRMHWADTVEAGLEVARVLTAPRGGDSL